MRTRNLLLAITFALSGATVSVPRGAAFAGEAYWPSDLENELGDVEDRVLELQRELAAARLHNEEEKTEKLGKEFKKLQERRLQLLRDTHRVNW